MNDTSTSIEQYKETHCNQCERQSKSNSQTDCHIAQRLDRVIRLPLL